MIAIIGKTIGMTQIIQPDGAMIPVTAVLAGPCVVTDVKNVQKHGYKSAQIGFGDTTQKHLSRPEREHLSKKKLPLKRWLKEIRLDAQENLELGQEIKADVFKPGDAVDVQGRSIGKGFAGGMKRWHWRGGPKSHGSMFHRRIGSAGASSFPSRTWPGHRMPGHLGNAKITVQNLQVMRVDVEKNLLLIKGSIPGKENGFLFIRKSLKMPGGFKAKVHETKLEKKKDAPGKKKEEKSKK